MYGGESEGREMGRGGLRTVPDEKGYASVHYWRLRSFTRLTSSAHAQIR